MFEKFQNSTSHARTHKAPVRRMVDGTSHGRPVLRADGVSRSFPRSPGLFFVAAAVVVILALLPSRQTTGQVRPPFPNRLPTPGDAFPATASAGFDRRESVLDRMREFKGKKTREALAALFVRMDPAFSQEPSVLLSDGSATARVTLRVPYRKGETPTFSISGGHCVTALTTDNGLWILEILPDRGSMATSVTVLSGGTMTEYPLTVAPPLNLLDPRKVEIVEIEYAVLANEVAAARKAAPQR